MLTNLILSLLLISLSSSLSLENVPQVYDCEMRKLALEYASTIMPKITTSQLNDIADVSIASFLFNKLENDTY